MKIGIDCRLGGIEHAGIGRYIEELVREVTKDTRIHWVLFFQKKNQFDWLIDSEHITQVVTPIRHYTVKEQILMPYFFLRENLDLLHVPHFNIPLLHRGKLVVTIHDLLWHDQRGENMTTLSPLMYGIKYKAYRYISSEALKRSEAVFVPARVVKETILSHMPYLDAKKIIVTQEGVDASWFVEETNKSHRETKDSKALFYTGSLYPHKNVGLVVEALRELPDYHLYISSSRNVFVDGFMKWVTKMGMGNRVTHLGRLSDSELRAWYHKSFALVQPSLSEGFGLTGIEAMATGLPVLASDIPIFREIYKDVFIPFDPMYASSFVEAVATLEKKSHTALSKEGAKLAKMYSWSKMARETVDTYMRVCG